MDRKRNLPHAHRGALEHLESVSGEEERLVVARDRTRAMDRGRTEGMRHREDFEIENQSGMIASKKATSCS
jgi:hypothetical protein